jgi:flavin-dependent dehydrogenase
LYETPVVISQISFDKKKQVENHVLLIGDAAGMITPLCGNGMSMAMHGSKIAFAVIKKYLSGKLSHDKMEEKYQRNWNTLFKNRLLTGRVVQWFFGSPVLSNILISILKPFPKLVDLIISQTHGKPF